MRISDWSSDVCSSDLIAREPSHRLQAPHMRFGKSIGGGWIMPQMCIDRIAPAIGGGDFGDGAIDLADAMLGGRDRNDRAIVRRPERDRKSTRLNSSH